MELFEWDPESDHHLSKKAEILEVLQDRGDWISTGELKVINHRFSACIHDLRAEGHTIDSRKKDSGEFEWLWLGHHPKVATDDTWKNRYYSSSHWKNRRAARLSHDGHQCCNCKVRFDLEVHHWRYDLYEERLGDLMTFCRKCHERIHATVEIAFPRFVSVKHNDRLLREINGNGQQPK